MSGFDVFLGVNRRQFRCKNCHKVFSEELSFVKKRRTYTKRLAEKVIEEVLSTDVVNAGKRNRMSPAEIETILKELEEDLLKEKPTELKKLGIKVKTTEQKLDAFALLGFQKMGMGITQTRRYGDETDS